MKLLAQDGHNAGQKISTAIAAGIIDGAIVSAKCHEKDRVADFITTNLDPRSHVVLFDPEFYAGALIDADSLGKLETHDYFKANLSKSDFKPKSVIEFAEKTQQAQIDYGLQQYLSPATIIEGFNSFSSGQAYNMYLASIDACDNPEEKLILSLVVTHASLSKKNEIEAFLNDITTLELKGFYVVVDRSSSYSSIWNNPQELAGLLLLVNVLSTAGYEVHVGYTDASGLLCLGAGATSIATGWFKNLRIFKHSRYYTSGGRNPKQAYFSSKLMNFTIVEDELSQVVALGLSDQVMSGVDGDNELIETIDDPIWNQNMQLMNYWASLKSVITELDAADNPIDFIESKVDAAIATYQRLSASGVTFDTETGITQVERYKEAISIYRGWKNDII